MTHTSSSCEIRKQKHVKRILSYMVAHRHCPDFECPNCPPGFQLTRIEAGEEVDIYQCLHFIGCGNKFNSRDLVRGYV